jgi:hypothetical protein
MAPSLNESNWWYTSTFTWDPPDIGTYNPTTLWLANDQASLKDCVVCLAMLIASIAVVAGTGMGLAMLWP